jgi:hypothetical protein
MTMFASLHACHRGDASKNRALRQENRCSSNSIRTTCCHAAPDLIAAWLVDDALDFDSGMQSKKYRPVGYVVRLLVNSTPTSSGAKDIIDVLGCSDERIALLAHRGWNFGVLEHTASLRSTSGAHCDAALGAQ